MVVDERSTRPAGPDSEAAGDALARRLADLARELHDGDSHQEVLDRAVAAAVALVPGARAGSICLLGPRRTVTAASATDSSARHLEELQAEVGEGPCLEAVLELRSSRVDDLAAETARWPVLATRAREVGMASALCLRLSAGRQAVGALTLLGEEAGAFSEASELVGQLLATHAAVAVAGARTRELLQQGLVHRDVIGQAKGILMERHRLSADQAFELLSRLSQDLNRKVHDIAADLAATGELPDRPTRRGPRPPGR